MSSPVTPFAERHLNLVRTAANVILWMAILFPLLELLTSLWPAHLESATWRFGAAGLMSNYVMGASIELLLLVVLALFTNSRRGLLVLGTICAIIAVLLLGGALMFVLDAVQTRSKVTPVALHKFDVATAGALAKMLLFAFANGMLARGSFRGAAGDRVARAKAPVSPIVVGQR